MTRSRLRNRSPENSLAYKTQRHSCTKLLRKQKRDYYNSLDTKMISDNKTFWNTVKPMFSDKSNISHKMALIQENNIISDDLQIAELFNEYFSTIATKLNIGENDSIISDSENISDTIFKAIEKYKNHPSIIKIAENVNIDVKFKFPLFLKAL